MKKQLLAASLAGIALLAPAAKTAKTAGPVIMTVAGVDVPLGEFEYLYKKNSSQQLNPQTLEEYVQMFVDYKLKVADARAAGVDTTAAFRGEFGKFQTELSEPYFKDQAVSDSLVRAIYDRMGNIVTVSHIMMPADSTAAIEALRADILSGKVSFEDAARQHSIDKPSGRRGGLMGPVSPMKFPLPFEEMAYATALGQVSPVVNSGFGLHLIRVESIEPAQGEVHAAHILRTTRNLTEDQRAAAKTLIDSIYNVVKADPQQFADMARQYSQDGSAQRGGDLGWFGRGVMVPEFDSISFALPVGGISEPFTTQFGWHIIYKDDQRDFGSLDDNREKIQASLDRSKYAELPRQRFFTKQFAKFGGERYEQNYTTVADMAADGVADMPGLLEKLKSSTLPLYKLDGKVTTVADVATELHPDPECTAQDIVGELQYRADKKLQTELESLSRAELLATNPDYANLINEYRDGIMLFEVSNNKVWDKAAKDTLGLRGFFEAHRDKYTWEAPKYKACVVFANSDSLLNVAMDYAAAAPAGTEGVAFVEYMRSRFGKDIKVERVIAAQGENAITDYLGFGAEKPEVKKGARWGYYAPYAGRVISAPEEADDAKGAVVSDYQQALEQAWVQQLRRQYPVKINKKVLKKVK